MRLLITGRWLLTHAFAVAMIVTFVLLGFWQLHRAESGNTISYAYAFEWPSFALLVIGFWIKIVRDELRPKPKQSLDEDDGAVAGRLDQDAAELATYNRYLAERAAARQAASGRAD